VAWVGGLLAGGGALLGGLLQSNAAQSAASTQAGAAENAQQIAQNQFYTITGQENPYMQAGYGAQSQLNYLLGIGQPGSQVPQGSFPHGGGSGYLGNVPGTASSSTAGGYGSLLSPFTAAYMKQYSPGYNFQLQQGEQGTLAGDASSAGALSGSAQKDLMGFNQGYANTAFNNAFNQYQTQQGNIYQRLAGISQLGQAAAANTGQQGTALAGSAAQSATNIGTALGAGTVGSANALTGGMSNALPWLMAGSYAQPQGGAPLGLTWNQNTSASEDVSGAAQAAMDANFPSDRRLKSDIEKVGVLHSGLTVYRYRYGGAGPFFLGVMADEAEKVFPQAVSTGADGYQRVNYGGIA
jgi:hypothetical protein